MRCSIASVLFAGAAFASLAMANTVQFVGQDSKTRNIVFTPNAGFPPIATTTLTGLGTQVVAFPSSWQGNFYAYPEGAPNVPGMLGEVMFGGYAGANYFDISAIVNPGDNDNIKELFPAVSKSPLSGCQTFPCANAYNNWDDIQTLSTTEPDLVCLVGTLATARRHPRHFITGDNA